MRDFTPVLTSILSAAASRLNEEERPTGRTTLSPGAQVAWDDCCAGQLYLRVIEIYPSAGRGGSGAFPQMDSVQKGVGCGITLLAAHLALGVIRCAATLDDDGNAPTDAQMSADALGSMADLSTLLDVLGCDLSGLPGVMASKVGRWLPQGVQGGCVGGEWDFYVALDPCLCQTPAPLVDE